MLPSRLRQLASKIEGNCVSVPEIEGLLNQLIEFQSHLMLQQQQQQQQQQKQNTRSPMCSACLSKKGDCDCANHQAKSQPKQKPAAVFTSDFPPIPSHTSTHSPAPLPPLTPQNLNTSNGSSLSFGFCDQQRRRNLRYVWKPIFIQLDLAEQYPDLIISRRILSEYQNQNHPSQPARYDSKLLHVVPLHHITHIYFSDVYGDYRCCIRLHNHDEDLEFRVQVSERSVRALRAEECEATCPLLLSRLFFLNPFFSSFLVVLSLGGAQDEQQAHDMVQRLASAHQSKIDALFGVGGSPPPPNNPTYNDTFDDEEEDLINFTDWEDSTFTPQPKRESTPYQASNNKLRTNKSIQELIALARAANINTSGMSRFDLESAVLGSVPMLAGGGGIPNAGPSPSPEPVPVVPAPEIVQNITAYWGTQPNGMTQPLFFLLSTIQNALPPNFNCETHPYFFKWKPISLSQASDLSEVKRGLKRARFFLHPDKLPLTLSASHRVAIKVIWNLLGEAEDVVLCG